MRPGSQQSEAARLSDELGVPIDRETVRRLKAKGIDLHDLDAVKHAFAMMERSPLSKKKKDAPDSSGIADVDLPTDGALTPDKIDARLNALQRELLHAIDYETARKVRTQIAGIKDLIKVETERGTLMATSDAQSAAMRAGAASRAAWEKLEADLPPMLEGLNALQMASKLRDYGRLKSKELSEHFTNNTQNQ